MEITPRNSIWAPFQYPFFRMIWIAAVVSFVGTWMQEVAAAWLMTSLTDNPLLVAMVQVANSLPIFLLALPAGALADILDRRIYLLVLQTCMGLVATLLAITTFLGWITPLSLLLYTFSLGAFYALNAPTWQASMPELVPKKALPSAITLNSLGVNISRSIGPAIAGIIIAAAGTGMVFALNAISFIGVIYALTKWKREFKRSNLPTERLWSAMRAGVRYVKGAPGLQNILFIAAVFFLFGSAQWALLPLVARNVLQRGPISYGILLGLLGLGAVIGAYILSRIRERLKPNFIVQTGSYIFALSTLCLGLSNNFYLDCLATLIGGIAWIAVLTTLNTVAQLIVAPWVRARALSIYLIAFFGGLSIGSTLWGFVAMHLPIQTALLIAGFGLFLCFGLIYFFSLEKDLDIDHTLTGHSPGPIAKGIDLNQGPTMVTIAYTVENKNIEKFIESLPTVRQLRLRNGAFFWNVFTDINDSNHFIECFMVESWVEHLRQHERVSVSDKHIIDHLKSFASSAPIIMHYVAYDFAKPIVNPNEVIEVPH